MVRFLRARKPTYQSANWMPNRFCPSLLVTEHFNHPLPPLDAVENEDWGRDYVLQHFQRHSAEELASAGLIWDAASDPSHETEA